MVTPISAGTELRRKGPGGFSLRREPRRRGGVVTAARPIRLVAIAGGGARTAGKVEDTDRRS